jgi:hypothetical protein
MKPRTKIILILTSVLIVLVVAYSIHKYIQRKNAREILDKKVTAQSKLNLKNAFSTTRWKTGKPKISDATGRSIAQKINGAIGWFTEDEDQINKAFYGIQNYDDLSVVSYQYKILFEKDLYTTIEKAYDGDDVKLARLRSIIAKKVAMQ